MVGDRAGLFSRAAAPIQGSRINPIYAYDRFLSRSEVSSLVDGKAGQEGVPDRILS
jgi:hypothetical protein